MLEQLLDQIDEALWRVLVALSQALDGIQQVSRTRRDLSEPLCFASPGFGGAPDSGGGGGDFEAVRCEDALDRLNVVRDGFSALRSDQQRARAALESRGYPGGEGHLAVSEDSLQVLARRCLDAGCEVQGLRREIAEGFAQLPFKDRDLLSAQEAVHHAVTCLEELLTLSAARFQETANAISVSDESLVSSIRLPYFAGDPKKAAEAPRAGAAGESPARPDRTEAFDRANVHFSAVAPRQLPKDDTAVLRLYMYEEAFRHIVEESMTEEDVPVREFRGSALRVREGAAVRVVLTSPDLPIEDGEDVQTWYGEYLIFHFSVSIPADYPKKRVTFTAFVYLNDVRAARLTFTAECVSAEVQRIAVARQDTRSAFISYASQDRNRVASVLQGMKKILPDMDVFFDVESLRSGEEWEPALRKEIDARDVLYLFWSRHARQSEWVDAEWHYALERKGIESIEPVPIESPEVCPPPEELRRKHFNDRLLYIINQDPGLPQP